MEGPRFGITQIENIWKIQCHGHHTSSRGCKRVKKIATQLVFQSIEIRTILFDSWRVVKHEYSLQSQNITREYDLEFLNCLYYVIQHNKPNLCVGGTWGQHHNNTPFHFIQWFTRLPILLTRLLVILAVLQDENTTEKVTIEKRSYYARSNVCCLQESFLREIRVSVLQLSFYIFHGHVLDTSWTDLKKSYKILNSIFNGLFKNL